MKLGQRWVSNARVERIGPRCASVATRTGANMPHYIIDSEDVLPNRQFCGSMARLEGHEQGLQRDVGSYRSAH